MSPQRVWCLRRFGPKTGFWSQSKEFGNARPYLSFQFEMNKKERVIARFEMAFTKSFSWRSNLSNDNIISAYTGSENG